MKAIITSIILFLAFIVNAQTIPVEGYVHYKHNIPDGAYIKDVNNVLDKYVGTWTGTYANKNYTFFVTKVKMYHDYIKFTEDLLLIRYTITDASGSVLEDTSELSDREGMVIEGRYMDEWGKYVLHYSGRNSACGQKGDIYIGMMHGSNNTQMFLALFADFELYPSCTTGPAEQILPYGEDSVVLTKQ